MDLQTLDLVQARIAESAIGASTLRNQGADKVVRVARDFLKGLDLRLFQVETPEAYRDRLDEATARLQASLPDLARHWGTARKALNIFLRDTLYNRYLCDHYQCGRLEPWLEVPLDRDVATGLQSEPEGGALPTRWGGVKHLLPDLGETYQGVARDLARRLGLATVHLDLLYWRRAIRSESEAGA